MALMSGTRLGPYEIQAAIGSGGMGDVYRARDTRLDRTVAIKVLPEHIAADPSLRERFEREARTISSLDHPHICALYDVGEDHGTAFLVMQFLEGETLAARLAKGALPLDQALEVATEIADALDRAHRAGIVHRDVKPGNIMLTKSGAKLLDFGLAKHSIPGSAGAPAVTGASITPTVGAPLTAQGTILGTFQYMAPEQLEGEEADVRSDIFAFGSVLHEMITGRKAFEGKTQASLIGGILHTEPPPVSAIQTMTPPALDQVVRRCLAKNPDDRWQSARDLLLQLKWIAEGSGASVAAPLPARTRRRYFALALAGAAGLAVGAAAVWLLRPDPPAPRGPTRFAVTLLADQTFTRPGRRVLALSPDGGRLVYVANGRLYNRSMDRLDVTEIRGTDIDPAAPTFSPDGQWIAFWAGESLRKVPATGGTPVTLCSAQNPLGLVWHGDRIIFGQAKGIFEVSATGGTPTLLVAAKGELLNAGDVLPDRSAILFAARADGVLTWNDARVILQSLRTGERRVVAQGGTSPRFAATGHVLYLRYGTIFAVPLDPARLEPRGGPVPIVEGVRATAGGGSGDAYFSASPAGTLAYVSSAENTLRTLVWVDRSARETPLPLPPRPYVNHSSAPDGKSIAVEIRDDVEHDIWIWNMDRETLSRLTSQPEPDTNPVWASDGRRLFFAGPTAVYATAPDAAGKPEPVWRGYGMPESISPDGRWLILRNPTASTSWDLIAHPLKDGGSARSLVATRFIDINARLSPDGRWLAYQSNESGTNNVYARPFLDTEERRWQVSGDGGQNPVWSRNGREIFYVDGMRRLVRVAVDTTRGFSAGRSEPLFNTQPYSVAGNVNFEVSPDGQRFLMIRSREATEGSPEIVVVEDWFAELKARVP